MKKTLLFTIIMALLCLASPMSAQKDIKPDGNGMLDFKSDNATMWVWVGSISSDWNNKNNWDYRYKTDGNPKDGVPEHNTPTSGDLVYIPKLTSGYYPNIFGMTCDKIYIAAGAMVLGQYGANINEWYTDVVIPTNEWVLVSSPLKGTYSGDFFTHLQGGKYTGAFDSSIYQLRTNGGNVVEGNEGLNRTFPSSIYQRLFSTFASTRTAAGYYIEPESFESAWSSPTNALATKYQVAQGLQVYARDLNNLPNADFHFPSAETAYHYFTTAGNEHSTIENIERSAEEFKKPAYSGTNGIMNITVTRDIHNANNDQTDVPPTFAVGNPAFARMSIAEFLRVNFSNGNTAPYLYKSDNEVYGLVGGDLYKATPTDYFNNPTTNTDLPTVDYIERDRGFLVMAGDDKAKPAETKLIGTYTMEYVDNATQWSSNGNITRTLGVAETHSGNGNYHNPTTHTITISETTDPNFVRISGFAGFNSVLARINTADNTLTISEGQPMGNFIDSNNNSHELTLQVTPSNSTSQFQNITFNSVQSNGGLNIHNVTTKRLANFSNNDLIIHYAIDEQTNEVTLTTDQVFAIYPSDGNHYCNGVISTSFSAFHLFRWSADYTTSINTFFSSSWNYFVNYNGSKPGSDITNFDQDPTVAANKDKIDLTFTPEMFDAPVIAPTPSPAHKGPRKTAALGGTIASVNANYNNYNVNTFIKRDNGASNGYKRNEDAALFDLDNEAFTIASLSGSQVVAINTINDTTAAQLYLTGVNGNVELVFDNLEALGENVRLFDANDSTERPLNGSHDNVTVNFGVNDSPLRYSLVWDYAPIISGNETLVDLDFTVFSPAKGEVKVMSGDMMNNVRLYNAAGQLVKSIAANSNDASFSALLPGIYVVEIYTSNGRGTKKVDVK